MSISLKSNADGTTGAIQLNGVDVLSVGNGGKVVIPNSEMLGVGQTWQNMTPSRALNVTYTNDTGRTIAIVVSGFAVASSGACYCNVYVGGQLITTMSAVSASSANAYLVDVPATVIVPNGSTYSASNGGSWQLDYWTELR